MTDLWSTVAREGQDFIIFFDHAGGLARVRLQGETFRIGWATAAANDDGATWVESSRLFGDPREAAFYAFQGEALGNK